MDDHSELSGELARELKKILPSGQLPAARVLTSTLDRVAWAVDASFYRAVPRAVVFPSSVEEIQALFGLSHRSGIPLTFRASGTSLSGQAITEGILVSVTRGWRNCEPLDQGHRVRVGPGVIGARVNRALAPFGRKIGPDPASIDSARMGGILANNSSGMCCGVSRNAYHTLSSMRFVLPSGLVIDTSSDTSNGTSGASAGRKLREGAPELERELREIRREILASPELTEKIRRKHRIKNTMGYGLNAFLDHEEPVQILAHLMIGSEGTLGFIAEATLETVPDARFKATALLTFDSVESACLRVSEIEKAGAQAIELLDRASLRSVQGQPGVPPAIASLPEESAALVVEFHFESEAERAARLPGLEALLRARLETSPGKQEELWKVRKGVLPSIASAHAPGASVIIEDVAVPTDRLAPALRDLREILDRNGYRDGVIFGHAKDGNLHFVITQAFEGEAEIRRYARMMEELASMIALVHGGSLKAEHGTGRNMAPFVELEWGSVAYAMMRRLKRSIDPRNLLNPGVILNDDPRAHLKDIKSLPAIDPETDRCMECGFCESRCPSQELTLTPRQRIAVRREMARAAREPETVAELGLAFEYSGIDTCAADGACQTACPVSIDTGALVKRLRSESRSAPSRLWAEILARAFWAVERAAALCLRAAFFLRRQAGAGIGDAGLRRLTRYWNPLFRPTTSLPRSSLPSSASFDYVYLPSCVNRVLGGNLPGTVVEVAKRAGKRAWIPPGVRGICCGTPFGSKGFPRAQRIASDKALRALWKWSREGQVPVIVDQSPCALALKEAWARRQAECRSGFSELPESRALRILDSIEAAEELVPTLRVRRKAGRIALHPVCSVEKMRMRAALESLASRCAEGIFIPASARCCGFAGDLGLRVPELTGSATREMAREIADARDAGGECAGYFSTSTTCEIALTQATGKPYRSIWHLLDEVSR